VWALDNRTPYAAERTWVLDKNAAKSWVVVVKGTFNIHQDGTTELAKKQEEPLYGPEYSGEPGTSSILYEADLIASKQATDVLLIGQAYAPEGKPVRQLTVEMKVGPIKKELSIVGDRIWEKRFLRGLRKSKPKPFVSMPITYERAYGGTDTRHDNPAKHGHESRNPIGRGFVTHKKHLIGQPLPNIEDPNQLFSSWRKRPHPTGFGPIASYWSPRREYAGIYDVEWQKERFPLLPQNFNERFFQCAPVDQQVAGFLRGGEDVTLTNLTPNGIWSFLLPRMRPIFTTYFRKERVEHRGNLHTVIIEPDKARVILVWHTSLPCHHKVDKLDVTRIWEKKHIAIGKEPEMLKETTKT